MPKGKKIHEKVRVGDTKQVADIIYRHLVYIGKDSLEHESLELRDNEDVVYMFFFWHIKLYVMLVRSNDEILGEPNYLWAYP